MKFYTGFKLTNLVKWKILTILGLNSTLNSHTIGLVKTRLGDFLSECIPRNTAHGVRRCVHCPLPHSLTPVSHHTNSTVVRDFFKDFYILASAENLRGTGLERGGAVKLSLYGTSSLFLRKESQVRNTVTLLWRRHSP